MKQYKIEAGTIARTIILALAFINQILSITNHPVIPISDESIESLVSYIVTVAATLWAWWKNNSFTQAALHGDEQKDLFKKNG